MGDQLAQQSGLEVEAVDAIPDVMDVPADRAFESREIIGSGARVSSRFHEAQFRLMGITNRVKAKSLPHGPGPSGPIILSVCAG